MNINKNPFADIPDFYRGKKIFITGHTGFKGSWLCKILSEFNANAAGYSLEPPTKPYNLFEISNAGQSIKNITGDIRDYTSLKNAFDDFQPEIVIHMAAQPIVRESYKNPAYTYEVNTIGTVNILECVRNNTCVKSFLNVTTDKVYKNREWFYGYRENEELDGYDPYSNSKSCSELITHSYARSFFNNHNVRISTARAGNVIGGGDFSIDRIIPDCVRAMMKHEKIAVRNPYSIRPYQHVLEPLFVYLMIAAAQYNNSDCSGSYNVGPNESDCISTGELADLFIKHWQDGAAWENLSLNNDNYHEANFLKLDCSKLKSVFNWRPRWNIDQAVQKTVEWTKIWLSGGDVNQCMSEQIKKFLKES